MALKIVALQAKEFGPPCSECRYKRLTGSCGNPAYLELTFDPATGGFSQSFNTPVSAARADDGLCGPEAQLFEPISISLVAIGSAMKGAREVWILLAAALFGASVLTMLLGR